MVKFVERDSYFAGFSVEPDMGDISIDRIAKGIADMSARFGRPEAKNEGRNCRFIFPAFSRPSDVAGRDHRVSVWIEGHSVEDVRAAFRAARKSASPGPISGDSVGDSRGDVALCRGCRIEVEPGGSGYCVDCSPDRIEDCGRCNGTGVYRGAGYVENGVFKGYTGVCFRCKGRRQVRHAVNVAGERGRGQYAINQFAGDFR